MGVTVGVNNLSVVHADSGGVTIAFPDVCKTPAPPAPPIPIPYPNTAKSSDTSKGTTSVKCDGNPTCVKDSNFMMSTGDEAGSLFGVASNKVKGKAEFVNVSFDVKFEGKGVARAFDPMLHNDKNTPPFPLLQGPVIEVPMPPRQVCVICDEEF
jgi:peptidoglycan hydrolase-like amidase